MREDLFTKKDGRWETFICTCTDEGLIEAGRLKQEVRRLLTKGYKRPCTASNFLTCVSVSLNWDHDAYISCIASDMWSGVTAKSDDFTAYAQCDQVEDGIAAVWYAFWLKKRERDEEEVPLHDMQ